MESDLWQAAINIPKGERKTDAGTGGVMDEVKKILL